MKLGLVLEERTIEGLVALSRAAEAAGIDLVWLRPTVGGDTALLAATAVAACTHVIRLAACVETGGHPLAIAEAAAVADNCSNGRLVLVLEDRESDSELLEETVDVVLAATASLPFSHSGRRWRIPANLPENDQHEERIVVTPYTVQPELPVWLLGPAAAAVGRSRSLSHVASESDGSDHATLAWKDTERSLGPGARRLRRPALRRVDADAGGAFAAPALVEQLRADQRAWGLDTAVLRLRPNLDQGAWAHAVSNLAAHVRPRLSMHELPAGLDQHWSGPVV
jgi:alkanesulfonate monooxygenase SsuD/methylene tetrahydromethanopterin reductase-like flavin-dependent oxidoreductase (luciferase family)